MNAIDPTARRASTYPNDDPGAAPHAGVPGNTPLDCRWFDENHDYDRCGLDETPIENPALFVRQGGDADAVDRADVQQGQAGDCALMATLSALASSPDGRVLLKNAIAENRNSQGEIVSYTVTLHRPSTWSHWGGNGFEDVKVTVDGGYVKGHAGAREDNACRQNDGSTEVWPLVFEKAYAQLRGGYNETCHTDSPIWAMEALTGAPATAYSLRGLRGLLGGCSAEQLQSDLAAGKLVVVDTRAGIDGHNSYGLIGGHAYQVTGTELRDGVLYVNLHNPWNKSEPSSVPYSDLSTWCSEIDVGSVGG